MGQTFPPMDFSFERGVDVGLEITRPPLEDISTTYFVSVTLDFIGIMNRIDDRLEGIVAGASGASSGH